MITRPITRRRLLQTSATAIMAPAVLPRLGYAQGAAANWPTKPVRLIVPFPPGGGTDTIGRILLGRLSEIWGQPVVVENRGGAGSNIGNEAAARSDPDGYTILFSGVPLSINPLMYKSLPYDPIKDLTPIVVIGNYPNVMVVPNSSPAKTVAEFIEMAKQKPGSMTFGSNGVGTSPHLSGEMFVHMAGIKMTHVPYRGAGPALNDLIPGRIDMMFNTLGALLKHIRGGVLRGLAVSSAERFYTAPDLPTVAESGVPGFDIMGWYGLAAPAKTPPEIIAKINADARKAMAEPELKKRIETVGVGVAPSTPEQMAARVQSDMKKWEPIIKAAGVYKSQ